MRQYDFQAFLDRVSELNYFEMIIEANRESSRIESALSPGRGRKGIDKQYVNEAIRYRSLLGAFIFTLQNAQHLIENHIKPSGVSDSDFLSFRPVINKLVERGQLKPAILKLFEDF